MMHEDEDLRYFTDDGGFSGEVLCHDCLQAMHGEDCIDFITGLAPDMAACECCGD